MPASACSAGCSREILRVGLLGSLTTLTANATAMVMAGLVGRFGVAALAGYGIGVRLEFMVAPIAFGIGTGLTTLVGVAAGAGAWRRAVRAAWIGGLVSFGVIGLIGWTVALMPESWARLFTSDAAVVAASAAYITRVAPFYCLFGLALTLYFASQGAGRMTVPVVAGVVRMVATVLAGWLAVEKFDLGIGGRVRGDCRRDGRLWRPDGGTVAADAVAVPASCLSPGRGRGHEGRRSLTARPRTGRPRPCRRRCTS